MKTFKTLLLCLLCLTVPVWAVHAAVPELYPLLASGNFAGAWGAFDLARGTVTVFEREPGSFPVMPVTNFAPVHNGQAAEIMAVMTGDSGVTVAANPDEAVMGPTAAELGGIDLQKMTASEVETAVYDQLTEAPKDGFWTSAGKKLIIASPLLLLLLLLALLGGGGGADAAGFSGGSGFSGGPTPQFFTDPIIPSGLDPGTNLPGDGIGDPNPNDVPGGNPGENPGGNPGDNPGGDPGGGGPGGVPPPAAPPWMPTIGPGAPGTGPGTQNLPDTIPNNPEPATMLLFGLGALTMLRKKVL